MSTPVAHSGFEFSSLAMLVGGLGIRGQLKPYIFLGPGSHWEGSQVTGRRCGLHTL